MLTPDLTPIYAFIGLIVTLLSVALVFAEGRAQRSVLLAVIFGSLGVGFHLHHTQLTDRLANANQEIAALAKCQGTGELCQWETH